MKNPLYTPRSLLVRCAVILAGVAITAAGAACYVTVALGSDPVTAFVQGIGLTLGLSFGMAMNLFNAVCFVLVLVFNRRLIHIGTLLYTFTLGLLSDAFIALLLRFLGATPALWLRVLLLAVGTVCIGFGLGLYQAARFGIGPSDALNQTLAAKLNIPLKYERIGFDLVMVAGGFLLGGTVHVGTLVGMLLVGPIMAPTITVLSPHVDRWAGKSV